MAKSVRRVVTGHDAGGKAVVLMDGAAPNQKVRNAGIAATLLWATDETPADMSGVADRAARETGVPPPPSGSFFRVVDFPPITAEAAAKLDQSAIHREMGLTGHASGAGTRHPFTHRTRSVDYAIILEGEIDMLLDDSEVHLKAGDVLVQQGTNHAWVNNSGANCRIAFVLIDAIEPAAWRAR
ncbi:MAG TPA: cupin domain-containing protein [Xanthobacteraceae bacterium]|nr:cupin domain-containing protein [Xanthobacteraceae bacterium]